MIECFLGYTEWLLILIVQETTRVEQNVEGIVLRDLQISKLKNI
jgi:hypothetical protein